MTKPTPITANSAPTTTAKVTFSMLLRNICANNMVINGLIAAIGAIITTSDIEKA